MAALSRAIPGSSHAVGPTNDMFWRDMVLAHFDFPTDGTSFNVDDWGGGVRVCSEGETPDGEVSANDPSDDDEQWAHWHRHPLNGPLRDWARAHPGQRYPTTILTEAMHFWPALQTYFPPTTYGFLGTIQHDSTRLPTHWPAHEDAYSLFCDLLLLARFVSTDKRQLTAHSDGDSVVSPCLLGRLPTNTIVGHGFAMLTFCGIAPRFWFRNDHPVSARWSGLDGPLPPPTCEWTGRSDHARATLAQVIIHYQV